KYGTIRKVYSINIVYFDIGQGEDYVYHGRTYFKGLYKQDILELPNDQRDISDKNEPGDLYPEYYVLKVNDFNDLAENTLDEWIYFLKNNRIEEGFSAKGLLKARDILDYTQLSPAEKSEYDYMREARTRHLGQIEYALKKGKLQAKEEYEKELEEQRKSFEEQRKKLEERDKKLEERDKKLEEKDKKLEEKDEENAKLREKIAEMERLFQDKQVE
ncbi:MAG: hypothetical protein LBF59_06095, partial [Prevotellaceae bacterium]|nr:hypothetical protein [Prevotellaceae bacterium]